MANKYRKYFIIILKNHNETTTSASKLNSYKENINKNTSIIKLIIFVIFKLPCTEYLLWVKLIVNRKNNNMPDISPNRI